MEKFKEILNDLILEKDLSLKQLKKESGVSATQYSKYLKGSIPTIAPAMRISNYFKCTLDYLFGVSEINEYKEQPNYDMSSFVSKYETLLKNHKISHWKFAKKYELSEAALRHWRSGDIPSIESLVKIAINLSTSIDYLVGRY